MDKGKTIESLKIITLYLLLFFGIFGGFFILKGLTGTEYPIMVVVSESMEPTLGVGDYILLQGVAYADNINVGDIIVFRKPGSSYNEYIVHRVIEKFRRGGSLFFRTQGDNNDIADWWEVPEYNIEGKVYGRIPLIGYFSLFERTSGGILTIIVLIGLVFFIDYIIPPRGDEVTAALQHIENLGKVLSPLTIGLLILSVLPYPLFFFLKSHWIFVEIFTLFCWYICVLLLPLAIKDEDNSLMLWLFHFVLLILPVGSDLIYRYTGIRPRDWWRAHRETVPITWFLSGETPLYYRYLSTLGLLLIPGCILFFYSWGKKRRGEPLLKI